MTLALISHASSLDHVTPPGHPERADRIRAVQAALEDERFALLDRREAVAADGSRLTMLRPTAAEHAVDGQPGVRKQWSRGDGDSARLTTLPEGRDPRERPWYQAAMDAGPRSQSS